MATDEKAYLVDREDVIRVFAGHQAGNFSTKEDAFTAIRLADAAYQSGWHDARREVRRALGITHFLKPRIDDSSRP